MFSRLRHAPANTPRQCADSPYKSLGARPPGRPLDTGDKRLERCIAIAIPVPGPINSRYPAALATSSRCQFFRMTQSPPASCNPLQMIGGGIGTTEPPNISR